MKNEKQVANSTQEVETTEVKVENTNSQNTVKEVAQEKPKKIIKKKVIKAKKATTEAKSEKSPKTKKDPSTIKEVKNQIKIETQANLLEEVKVKREVKYIYPAECSDTLSRKKYRQQIRNKLHKLELEMYRIQDKQSKDFKAKEKEYLEFKKATVKEGAVA